MAKSVALQKYSSSFSASSEKRNPHSPFHQSIVQLVDQIGFAKLEIGSFDSNLRELILKLPSNRRKELLGKIPQQALNQFISLSQESIPQIFWQRLYALAEEQKNAGKSEIATAILNHIVASELQPPLKIREQAQFSLNVIQGRGTFLQQAEYSSTRLIPNSLDPKMIAPMMIATMTGAGAGAWALGRIAFGRGFAPLLPKIFQRGLGARLAAATFGLGAEVPSFLLANRMARQITGEQLPSDFISILKEGLSTGLTLATMKSFGFLGNQIFLKLHHLKELKIPQLHGMMRFNQVMIPFSSMYLGMFAAHKFEEGLQLRPETNGVTAAMGTLESLISLSIGGKAGHFVLGRRFAELDQKLRHNKKFYEQFFTNSLSSYFDALPRLKLALDFNYSRPISEVELEANVENGKKWSRIKSEINIHSTMDPESTGGKVDNYQGQGRKAVPDAAIKNKVNEMFENPSLKVFQSLLDETPYHPTSEGAVPLLNFIETSMAFGELVAPSNPKYFEAFIAELERHPSWVVARNVNHNLQYWTRPFIPLAFSSTLERMQDPTVIQDTSKWNAKLPELWLYWSACELGNKISISPLTTWLADLLRVRRTLIRFAQQDPDTETLGNFIERFENLFRDSVNKYGNRDYKERYYFIKEIDKLWHDLINSSKVFDPLLPINPQVIPPKLERGHLDLLEAAISQMESENGFAKENKFKELLLKAQLQIDHNQIKFFQQAVNDPISILARKALLDTDKEETMPLIRSRGRRPVIWDPFSLSNRDLVISTNTGEGEAVGTKGGMLGVRFAGEPSIVWVPENRVIPASDTKSYEEVLQQRVNRFIHYPFTYTIAVIRKYFEIEMPQLLMENYFSSGKGRKNPTPTFTAALRGTKVQNDFPKDIWELSNKIGIDLLAFAMSLTVGENPQHIVLSETKQKTQFFGASIDRILTPDLVRGFLLNRPWQEDWNKKDFQVPPNVQSAGFYYPEYYRGSIKFNDLTGFYFDYRDGVEGTLEQAARLLEEQVHEWSAVNGRANNLLLVPIIGTAPNEALARRLGKNVLFPWLPRPIDYGTGVEGKRAMVKLQMVQAALKLDPRLKDQIVGQAVLLVDDNITDAITYMVARNLLLEAGASEVGLVALTQTIRDPKALTWKLR